jgi:hypothetical protein
MRVIAEGPFTALDLDKQCLVACRESRWTIYQNRSEIASGEIALACPKGIDAQPIVAASRQYCVACYPWSRHFDLIVNKTRERFRCVAHWSTICCLAIAGQFFASASVDGTVRVWTFWRRPKQGASLARHNDRVLFVRLSDLMKACYSISADGCLIVLSLVDGRNLGSVKLAGGEPCELLVTGRGFVCVCFRRPAVFSVVILDQNLVAVTEQHFDGVVSCSTSLELNGIEYIAVVLKSARLIILQMPYLTTVLLDVKLTAPVRSIAYAKGEQTLYMVTYEGRLLAMAAKRRE